MRRLRWLGPAVLLLFGAASARAQVAVDLTVKSDERVRGLTLSDGAPTLALDVAYDSASGAYAGISGLVAGTPAEGLKAIGYMAYAGYSARTRAGPVWDVGVANAAIDIRHGPGFTIRYTELYAGLTMGAVTARLAYSPDYLGEGVSTLYAEVDAVYRPADHWRLIVHGGVLTPLAGAGLPYSRRERYDFRAGVARDLGGWEAQLDWTLAAPEAAYEPGHARRRDGPVVSLTKFF